MPAVVQQEEADRAPLVAIYSAEVLDDHEFGVGPAHGGWVLRKLARRLLADDL